MASFDQMLSQSLDFSAATSDPFEQLYQWLKEIAESLERHLNAGLVKQPIELELEPGFQASIGQQFKFNVRVPSKQFRDTLFRAYIPAEGTPILLDLFGDDPVPCGDRSQLDKTVLEFLQRIKNRLTTYRDFAA